MAGAPKFPDRLLLWVDAVGSYLVCMGNEVSLGQPAVGGTGPDVPILGDLSRRHAIIRRDSETYSIEAIRPVRIDGRVIERTVPLADGNIIVLGDAVRLRFRRPHPLSATARLELASRHRTQPSTNAVLLMADACILGSAAASHVITPTWTSEVVLFRRADELACRTSAKVAIDGKPTSGGRGALSPRSRVEGEEFAFSLEPFASSE